MSHASGANTGCPSFNSGQVRWCVPSAVARIFGRTAAAGATRTARLCGLNFADTAGTIYGRLKNECKHVELKEVVMNLAIWFGTDDEYAAVKEAAKGKAVLFYPVEALRTTTTFNVISDMLEKQCTTGYAIGHTSKMDAALLEKYKEIKSRLEVFWMNLCHARDTTPARMANMRKNLRSIREKAQSRQAVVFGAGPSQLPYTYHLPIDDYVTISCGHAAQWVWHNKPHQDLDYIIEMDHATECNWEHDEGFGLSTLVAPPTLPKSIIDRFERVLWVNPGDKFDKHLRKVYPHFMSLDHGCGVIVSAVDFAKKIGCNEVLLIGNDLAFQKKPTSKDWELVQVEGVNGGLVWTRPDYDRIRYALELWIERNPDVRLCAVPEGAKVKGVEYCQVDEFFKG